MKDELMRLLVSWLALSLIGLAGLGSARAQSSDTEELSANEELVSEADPEEWSRPAILIVRAPRTPERLLRSLVELLEPVGEVQSWRDYERDARRRGLRPTAEATLETLLADRGITLVVVVSREVIRRRPMIRLTYREGRFGTALLTEEHPISGTGFSDVIAERIQAEAILAVAAMNPTSDAAMGGFAEPSPDRERATPDAGATVRFSTVIGAGVGTRRFEGPLQAGMVRLETSVFPTAALQIRARYEPTAGAGFSLTGSLGYISSIGLQTTDTRIDGSSRETSARSQTLDLDVGLNWRLGDQPTSTQLGFTIGWGMRGFDTEAPVSLPDYRLGGPTLSTMLSIALGDPAYRIVLGPMASIIFELGDGLSSAMTEWGWAVGGIATLQFQLTDSWTLEAVYRESHAQLNAAISDVSDVERYGTLNIRYEP